MLEYDAEGRLIIPRALLFIERRDEGGGADGMSAVHDGQMILIRDGDTLEVIGEVLPLDLINLAMQRPGWPKRCRWQPEDER